MSIGVHLGPLHDRVTAFNMEVSDMFNVACERARTEIRQDEERKAIRRIYENGAFTKFANLKASPENARYINSIYKLMKDFETAKKDTKAGTLIDMGVSRGFTEEESLCLYNLSRFEAVINNLKSQKAEVADLILSEL